MKLILQILFLFIAWFTNLVNATPIFTNVLLPSCELPFSKTENTKEESTVKIGIQNFARSGIEVNLFSHKSTSRESYALLVASRAGECKVVQGAGSYIKFLDDPAKASQFADEIIDINKATEGGGTLLSGSPSSAINTASYYATVPEQGASIFKTIIKNHMFADGNKRTAVNMFKSFCTKSGISTTLTDAQMMNVATKVATNELDDVLQISQQLIK